MNAMVGAAYVQSNAHVCALGFFQNVRGLTADLKELTGLDEGTRKIVLRFESF